MSLDELLAARSAVIVPCTLAATFDPAHFTRYALADRGSYAFLDVPPDPRLDALVEQTTGARRRSIASRVLRLEPGDYLLARHDQPRARGLDLIVDLSPAAVPGAEVHYRQHGQVLFRMPCAPQTAAIIPRAPSVSCNHTYVSKRLTGAVVVRWIAHYE